MNSHSPGGVQGEGHGPFTMFVDHNFAPSTPVAMSVPKKPAEVSVLDSVLKGGDRKKIKIFLRSNHWSANHDVRKSLWLKLCRLQHMHTGSIYKEAVKDVFGETGHHTDAALPSFVDPSNMFNYHLTEHGFHIVKKVVCVIGHTNPDITFSPVTFPMAALLLHYLDEQDCYDCLYGLIRSRENYLAQTKIAYEAARFVLKDLARKYAKPMYTYIVKHGMVVEGVFENWLWWVLRDLPFSYTVRIIDMFLYEGPKVLFRVALAILNLYYKTNVKSGGSGNNSLDLASSISQFCEDIPVPIDKLIKSAFSLLGLSRDTIRKLAIKNEMHVKSLQNAGMVSIMHKSASYDSLNLKVSASFNDHSNILLNDQGNGQRARSRSLTHALLPFDNSGSRILTTTEWQHIWKWLPTRITLYQPKLIYTTNEHGTSLNTFYRHCDGYDQTLLILKTTNSQILGAYCSADWTERKHKNKTLSYFGTGETFIFKLGAENKRYQWVGIQHGEKIPNSAHLFMAGDGTKLAVGGGNGEAIDIDHDLDRGRSTRCDTFNNDPLTSEEYFHIANIEVFAFE